MFAIFLALHILFVRFEDFGTNTFLYFFVSFCALGIIGKCSFLPRFSVRLQFCP